MRVHMIVDDDLVARVDRRAGKGGRTAYVAHAIRRQLDEDERWEQLERAIGALGDDGSHEWDGDAAAWVAGQRRGDAARLG